MPGDDVMYGDECIFMMEFFSLPFMIAYSVINIIILVIACKNESGEIESSEIKSGENNKTTLIICYDVFGILFIICSSLLSLTIQICRKDILKRDKKFFIMRLLCYVLISMINVIFNAVILSMNKFYVTEIISIILLSIIIVIHIFNILRLICPSIEELEDEIYIMQEEFDNIQAENTQNAIGIFLLGLSDNYGSNSPVNLIDAHIARQIVSYV